MDSSIVSDKIILFNLLRGSPHALLLWVQMDLRIMSMKGYSTFPLAIGLKSHHQMQIGFYIQDTWFCESYSSAEIQWASVCVNVCCSTLLFFFSCTAARVHGWLGIGLNGSGSGSVETAWRDRWVSQVVASRGQDWPTYLSFREPSPRL